MNKNKALYYLRPKLNKVIFIPLCFHKKSVKLRLKIASQVQPKNETKGIS